MKTSIGYIVIFLCLIGCQPSSKNGVIRESDFTFMNSNTASTDESVHKIREIVSALDDAELDSTTRKEYANRVNYEYIVYTYNGKPVKVSSEINENTYTVQATYYIHNNYPYYIKGKMRDRDRASGNYTHKELETFLNGQKVLKRLQKTGINPENRAADLSQMTQEDITHTIYVPELDAENRYKEVMRILGTPVD